MEPNGERMLSVPATTSSTLKRVSSTNSRSVWKLGFTMVSETIPRLLSPLLSSASRKKVCVESLVAKGPIVAEVVENAGKLQCRTSFGPLRGVWSSSRSMSMAQR